jgi:hypothetical protein
VSASWFSELAPVTAAIQCGADTHTVLWRDGVFSTPDHADPESERALAALAGEPCGCIELLDAWERHATDPLVLMLGPRDREALEPRDRVIWGLRVTPTGASRARGSVAPEAAAPTDALDRLLCLTGEIPRRYVATVADALAGRDDPALAISLEAALYGRLGASLRRWSGQIRWFGLEMSDGEPSLTRDPEWNLLAATLPFSWMTEVWGRGVDVVDDELTLSAHRGSTGTLTLLTVDHALVTHTRTRAGV